MAARSTCLPSGHDEKFASEVEDDFRCLICQLALREPVQTRCGHRFCKECLEEHLRRQEVQAQPHSCPADREGLDRDRDVFPDKATERKILSLAIMCPNNGCDWTGDLRNKTVHLASCPFHDVLCTNENCDMTLKRKDLEEHLTITCEWRIVYCEYCREPQPNCRIQAHFEQCDIFPVTCPNKCGDLIPREMIQNHIEKECKLALISCPYEQMGCGRKFQRLKMESHLQSAMGPHLDLTRVKLKNTQVELKNAQERIRKLEEKFHTRKMVWKIDEFTRIMSEAKNGTNTYIESDPFYTESLGYKLKVLLYPNGFGKGENTHLSVFIVIMKGEYDAILPWPFNKKVRFTLIDQQEDLWKRENVVDKSKTLLNPNEGEREGEGKEEFISHLKLQARRYVVDDTLFLQVEIDP